MTTPTTVSDTPLATNMPEHTTENVGTAKPSIDCFMSTPSIVVPPYIATDEDTVNLLERILTEEHPKIDKFRSIVRNTQVDKRHLARPLEDNTEHTQLELRQAIFEAVAPALALDAAQRAMAEVKARPEDIHAVITICATSPETMMPGIDQIIISRMGLPPNTRGYPVSQWGCRGGAAGLNLARELCQANRKRNVLVVTVELCSLLYQPADLECPKCAEDQQAAVICDALFGDAAGACVICGPESDLLNRPWSTACRMGLQESGSHQLPDSLEYMRYETSSNGLHFRLTNEVPKAMDRVAPVMIGFLNDHGVSNADLQDVSFLLHTGGPKVLLHFMQAVHRCCGLDAKTLLGPNDPRVIDSMGTLQAHGNVASVSLLATVRSCMVNGVRNPTTGDTCLIAGCGPGMGADWVLATLQPDPLQAQPESAIKIKDVILEDFDCCLVGDWEGPGGAVAVGLAALLTELGMRTAVMTGDAGKDVANNHGAVVQPLAAKCGSDLEQVILAMEKARMEGDKEDSAAEVEVLKNRDEMLRVLCSVEGSRGLCNLYAKFEFRQSEPEAEPEASGEESECQEVMRKVLAMWTAGGAGIYELRSRAVVDCNAIAANSGMAATLAKMVADLKERAGDEVIAFDRELSADAGASFGRLASADSATSEGSLNLPVGRRLSTSSLTTPKGQGPMLVGKGGSFRGNSGSLNRKSFRCVERSYSSHSSFKSVGGGECSCGQCGAFNDQDVAFRRRLNSLVM